MMAMAYVSGGNLENHCAFGPFPSNMFTRFNLLAAAGSSLLTEDAYRHLQSVDPGTGALLVK